MGGVDPPGDAGGVALPGDGHPAGLLIMMLRVTLTSTPPPPPSDRAIPPSKIKSEKKKKEWKGKARPLPPELGRKPKDECFRRRPRPVSGRGPATVSSQSWSRRPIVLHLITGMPLIRAQFNRAPPLIDPKAEARTGIYRGNGEGTEPISTVDLDLDGEKGTACTG
ncbi:hypothetical protein BHE74_00059678 [Ensete ventricosum]|nr:hypothetical protein GW17_00058323 [Ensete ventricosum]RWW35398.1 hypothetical protein BHE74_00059678 [Ensete ventricosum]